MRSAALPAQLAFRWCWLALRGNCQYLPSGGQTPEQTFQLVGYPIQWLDLISVCVCAHSTCVLPHLKAAVVPIQAACPPRWAKRESASFLPGQQKLFQVSPQLKVTVCVFYLRACRSQCGSLTAHQWAVKHRWLVPDAASAPSLLRKVCRSHFFQFHGTPQKWKTHKSQCRFVIPPSTSGRLQQ